MSLQLRKWVGRQRIFETIENRDTFGLPIQVETLCEFVQTSEDNCTALHQAVARRQLLSFPNLAAELGPKPH
jgi:hypothetical protein